MHSEQMYTLGPAMILSTSRCDLWQKEQLSPLFECCLPIHPSLDRVCSLCLYVHDLLWSTPRKRVSLFKYAIREGRTCPAAFKDRHWGEAGDR